MSAYQSSDRDKAILWARAQASATRSTFMVYQHIKDRDWHVATYPSLDEGNAINPSVRYVLPMGEVCKLS